MITALDSSALIDRIIPNNSHLIDERAKLVLLLLSQPNKHQPSVYVSPKKDY